MQVVWPLLTAIMKIHIMTVEYSLHSGPFKMRVQKMNLLKWNDIAGTIDTIYRDK